MLKESFYLAEKKAFFDKSCGKNLNFSIMTCQRTKKEGT